MSLLKISQRLKLPSSWTFQPIGKVLLSTQYGTSNGSVEEGIPVVGMKNIQDGKVNFRDLSFVSLSPEEKANLLLKKGDILLNRTNSYELVGKVGYVEEDFEAVFASYLVRLEADKTKSDPKFIAMWLTSFWADTMIKKIATRAISQANVNPTEFKKFCFIPVLPLPEQKAIADLLSTWDSAIEKTERLIAAKEKRFQWLLDELISKPSREGKWKEVQLKDVLTEGSKTPVSDTSSFSKITIKLRKKGLEFSANSREMADARPFYVRNKGEIIIGKQNFFNGSIAIISDEFDGCICSNAIMSFGVKHDYSKEFLFESISTSEFLKRREMLANGTGQKELSEKEFLNFKVAMPSLNEQEKIAHSLGLAQKEIDLLKFLAEKYKEQKRGLMQKLLTGEWRVKVANGGEVK